MRTFSSQDHPILRVAAELTRDRELAVSVASGRVDEESLRGGLTLLCEAVDTARRSCTLGQVTAPTDTKHWGTSIKLAVSHFEWKDQHRLAVAKLLILRPWAQTSLHIHVFRGEIHVLPLEGIIADIRGAAQRILLGDGRQAVVLPPRTMHRFSSVSESISILVSYDTRPEADGQDLKAVFEPPVGPNGRR